ncbi:glycoside hydrolase family 6 [Cellulomonas sp. H30R-01]|uniref:glycoside hydrolase family 6 protein n=1 Tax=Cellulomonas sp. H30R-01 TaxID=2704467 RepID=UPI00138BB56D|nr:glycoside hydrolase family 6 protein [Cellulomonas sp. H30R-01]QHT57558.1 glycoside hydrolase family 6 [Cellulomonas sp. H30R-01]
MPRTRAPMWRTALTASATLAVTLTTLAPVHAAGPARPGPTGAAPAPTATATSAPPSGAEFYTNPHSTTLEAAQKLTGQARADAQLLGSVPSADWFTGGTPQEVEAEVDRLVTAAAAAHQEPVLAAYNLPFRDCAQYSSGGAADTAAYNAWIDGFAAGIGDRSATVILEPDGLGIIPHYTSLDGTADWCQPAEADPATAAANRYEQLNHAVDALAALPDVKVYLDGTSSAWLTVGEISDRLVKAGVQRATGFFLNASNYQFTENGTAYGTWVSSCIAYATEVVVGDYASCGNQWWNGGPANDWQGVAMSQYGRWSSTATDPALNTAGIESRYASILGDVEPTTTFVIDTSRNALGPWQYPPDVYPAHEDWCNPPDRGLGVRPTTQTGNPLVDAYLWIKVPGESDGQCFRGTPGPLDPARGMADPAAGQWFTQQARELISLAVPELEPLTCHVKVHGTAVGGPKHRGFVAALTVENRGTERLNPWRLSWEFEGDQRVKTVTGGTFVQRGSAVTVTAPRGRAAVLAPGKKATVVVSGTGDAQAPLQFRLNGQACTS